ncbi:MAG TPA: hypothetical protein VGI56_05075 [Galbitalea sp.]|jgi:hypothetical protein
MRALLNVRIVRWPFKLLYAIGAVVVGVTVVTLIGFTGINFVVLQVITYIIEVGIVLYGARVFRSWNEDVAAPRPWWRMTARRPLSIVVAAVTVLLTVAVGTGAGSALGVMLSSSHTAHELTAATSTVRTEAVAVFVYATLAFFYVNSALRLAPKVTSKES